MTGCIFCRIIAGELPSYKVYEDEKVLVILDKYPASKGHLLVITKEHHRGLHQTPPHLAVYAFAVAAAIAKYYKEKLLVPGVNVLNNDGSAAGQVIFHTHIHVIPRWTRTGPVFHGRTEIRRDEAMEVLNMLSTVPAFVRDYLERAFSPTVAQDAS